MKKKIALAFAGLMLISIALAPTSSGVIVPYPGVQMHRYLVMGGEAKLNIALNYGPLQFLLPGIFLTRDPWLTPMQLVQDIIFGYEADPATGTPIPQLAGTGVVLLAVDNATYTPIQHMVYSDLVGGLVGHYWLLSTLSLVAPGGGWLYTGPLLADVDVIVSNNASGVYWGAHPTMGASPLAGQLAAPFGMNFPSPGADGLPGTFLSLGDPFDGFGNGAIDGPGSSVLFLPTVWTVHGYNETTTGWDLLFGAPLPVVMTTAIAYDVVQKPGSYLDGANSTEVGAPWQFVASGALWNSTHKDTKCNVKVTYACAWSQLDVVLDPGPPYIALDIFYEIWEKKVRDDVVIADTNCDQIVDIVDLVICGVAFGSRDEGLGYPAADSKFDARADMNGDGFIDISDVVRIAIDFGKEIDP